jgi:F-box domain
VRHLLIKGTKLALLSRLKMYKDVPLPLKQKTFKLADELWLEIFAQVPVEGLLKTRLVCRKWKAFSNDKLLNILEPKYFDMMFLTKQAEAKSLTIKKEKKPLLDHYKDFLTVPTIQENLNEVIWYSSAPYEVQAVVECLVRLKGGITVDRDERITWADLKKILKSFDFKLWMTSLATNVEFIDISDTATVEHIIRVEPLITYERLRAVSMAGYRLLILVAASLQFSSISNEVKLVETNAKALGNQLDRQALFLGSICK